MRVACDENDIDNIDEFESRGDRPPAERRFTNSFTNQIQARNDFDENDIENVEDFVFGGAADQLTITLLREQFASPRAPGSMPDRSDVVGLPLWLFGIGQRDTTPGHCRGLSFDWIWPD